MKILRLACPCGCQDEVPDGTAMPIRCWGAGCRRDMHVFGSREGFIATVTPMRAAVPAPAIPTLETSSEPVVDSPPAPTPPPPVSPVVLASQRAWLERCIAEWGTQAALTRRIACGRRAETNIAGALDEVVARLVHQLAALPAPAPLPAPSDVVSWASPIFHADDGFDPFAGTKADRMLASAATCQKLGCEEAARMFEQRAAECAGVPEPEPTFRERMAARAAALTPPPPPAPFAPGPQIELFAA